MSRRSGARTPLLLLLDPEDLPEWLTCADLAALRRVRRETAWRQMRALRAALAPEDVVLERGKWRARTSAVARHYARKLPSPKERLEALEREKAELVDRLADLERLVEAQARDLSRALSALRIRPSSPLDDD